MTSRRRGRGRGIVMGNFLKKKHGTSGIHPPHYSIIQKQSLSLSPSHLFIIDHESIPATLLAALISLTDNFRVSAYLSNASISSLNAFLNTASMISTS